MQKICLFAGIRVPLHENFDAMAGYLVDDARKVTTHRLIEMKQQGKKMTSAAEDAFDNTVGGLFDNMQ